MGTLPEPNRPFRWNVPTAQLGSLLDGVPEPDLWFADELVPCAAKLLARSQGGDLHFVGRSLDSVHDLLTGALQGTSAASRLHTLPISIRWLGVEPLAPHELAQLRANMTAAGLAPAALARRRTPVVFTDIVASGGTYENIHGILRDWIADERGQWDVIRHKLRYLGVTIREHTSPNTHRWQQHAAWTRELPARAIANVSLGFDVSVYFSNGQPKTSLSFSRPLWQDEQVATPGRSEERLTALAEAVAVTELGARKATREAIARLLSREPSFAEPWLRSLALELRR
ncbi:hypothetical protein DSM112329_01864 [Paraconexibacter sp. AEG42_29]|uniref:Uncharacterized protein n=1 Tax=Paraconexibacter sp. AEG42_29 TaxID=2997339 RepID=A0AAU7ATL7_9ACTN